MKTHAIIVAGGRGSRAGGDLPKQRQSLGGKLVYKWSLDVFNEASEIDQIVLVVPRDDLQVYSDELASDRIKVVSGGNERTHSVLHGLNALNAASNDKVLIHDAARPGLTIKIISSLISALDEADAAAPALPIADALKRDNQGQLLTVDRSNLYRVQTPQAFKYEAILDALNSSERTLVDDLAAVEQSGGRVMLIEGSEALAKITYPGDLERMEKLLVSRQTILRIGSGFDVHAFREGQFVTLCGIEIPHSNGLAGHSDADVAWHALTDAILGALSLGDIGDHFPPSDDRWKGAASSVFLKHAAALATEQGYEIVNCDITVICEAPKVKPHRETMRQRTADVLGLSIDQVSVKATTTEGLGFAGRREGIAAQAVCLLSPK